MAGAEELSTDISFISMPQSIQIIWKIDVSSLPDSPVCTIESPPFLFANAEWFFWFSLEENYGSSHALVRMNSLVPYHEIVLISAIDSGNNKYFYTQYGKLSFEKNNEEDSPEGMLPIRSEMLDKQLVVNGTLTLVFHLFSGDLNKENVYSQKVIHKMESSEILCRDFKNLLLNGKDYDLTLKVKDKEFRVHRNILRARSQVFNSILTQDMVEKNSGVVDIPDCDPQTMEQFLLYVYCAKMDNLNENNVEGLYYAADKYSMMSLKEECRDFMKKSMSCSNICDIIQLALNYTDERVLEYATKFFLTNTIGVLTTEKWMTFQKKNETFANELLIKASKKWSDTNQNAIKKLNDE